MSAKSFLRLAIFILLTSQLVFGAFYDNSFYVGGQIVACGLFNPGGFSGGVFTEAARLTILQTLARPEEEDRGLGGCFALAQPLFLQIRLCKTQDQVLDKPHDFEYNVNVVSIITP